MIVILKQETSICVEFNDECIIIPDVTKHTTCDDVIKIALQASASPEDARRYSLHLLGVSGDVGKILHGKTKILKVVRSKRANDGKHRIVLKPMKSPRSKMAALPRVKEKLQYLTSLVTKLTKIRQDNSKDIHNVKNDLNKSNVVNDFNINPFVENIILTLNERKMENLGKRELMHRYINDNTERTSDVSNDCSLPTDNKCRNIPTMFVDNSLLNNAFVDELEDELNSHDEAFVDSIDNYDSSMIDDATVLKGIDIFNDCMVDDDEAFVSDCDDCEDNCEEGSECSNICELERNISGEYEDVTVDTLNEIRNIFRKGGASIVSAHDEAIESFMYTLLRRTDDSQQC